MQQILKLGIKLLLFPFFIASVYLSFGFTSDQRNSELCISLDSCWQFMHGQQQVPGSEDPLVQSSNNSGQISSLRIFDPDSINKKIDGIKDSSKTKITGPDSSKVETEAVKMDSSLFKSKISHQDSNKTKVGVSKVDSALAKSKILHTDSTKTKIKISRADSIKAKVTQDSLYRIEKLSKDSTARLKYFRFSRSDDPYLNFRQRKQSSLYVWPSEMNRSRNIGMDSTGKKVFIEEKVAGHTVRPKLELSLDDYIKLRMDAIQRDSWETRGYEYKLKDTKKDLSQLITDITNIDIPLPSSPIFSIFGKPNINLRVSGQVDIHGAWRNETTEGVTTSALGNTRNEPDFKQQVQINLSGTIGDKLNINADWNTERQFQYENQLKIKYTGYEDEIVQSIEAGNVSLQTSPLVGGSEALFGVKASFRMGAFSLTALASQKKSEVKEVSLSSGAKTSTFEIHAYSYSQNHFFVDAVYVDEIRNIFNKYYGNTTPDQTPEYFIKDIQVWKTTTGLYNPNERKANAFINLPSKSNGELYEPTGDRNRIGGWSDSTYEANSATNVINSRFVLLVDGTDYTLHPETGFITFKTSLQPQDAIAVAFRIEGPTSATSDDQYYGEFTQTATAAGVKRLVLKLVKPPNLQPKFTDAWKLQLKNIYPTGGRKIKEEGFNAVIRFRTEGQEPQDNISGTKLIQAFNLDKTDKSKTGGPDGAFDFYSGRTIFPETGEIVFPVLQPFGKNFPSTLDRSLKYQLVYDTTSTGAQQAGAVYDKFTITGEYSAEISSNFSMGFNVVENSVKVLLGGAPLKEGVDYVCDYNLGQIVIRNDQALLPGADLKITYEQNDLFTLASKTMLGLRGLYDFNKETSLGFSFLNLNQQTLSDKVRIGEEPLNNSIFGVDFKTNINLPFLTKALSKVISTSTPSSLTLNAEAAYISPDPNTKKSTILSDENRSIAYVDDFEGAKRTIPLVEGYTTWHDISVPGRMQFIQNLDESEQIKYKGLTNWYNINPSNVFIKDIYGDRKNAPPDGQQITTLDFLFEPKKKGYYNHFPDLDVNPKQNWGGIMKVLSSTANNLLEENIEFIEFWINIVNAPPGSNLNIDLGQISEDVIPNNRLDSEDKNDNDLVEDGEDTGIDRLNNAQEQAAYGPTDTDPSGDDYAFTNSNGDYLHVNGTEGNAVSIDQGRIPDTEDLNHNKTLDKTNNYFRYVIPLDSTTANPFMKGGGGNKGWFLFKIPLKDFKDKIGDPSFSVVEFIRFWINGVDKQVHLRFAEMNLVGNQWQKAKKVDPVSKTLVDDSTLTLTVVNVEDNPDYYSPPGVQREIDRTQPQYNIQKNEQSLNLILNDLQDNSKSEVVRYLTRPLDVFNYKELKFFLHGDMNQGSGSVSHYVNENDYASEIYLRFGSDSLNYYEYRQPVRADWNEVGLKFSDLTAIKQARDSSKVITKVAVTTLPGASYGILGEPTLTRISFFTIGILNPKDKGISQQAVSGSVWINELRVLEAEQTPGWAYSLNASLQLADLLRVSVNASQTNPYFHKISDRFGSREETMNWGVSADLDLLKLIPVNLNGSNLRVTYSRNENASNSLYLPGTDVRVDIAKSQLRKKLEDSNTDPEIINSKVASLDSLSQTSSVSESWGLSGIKFYIPTDKWYIRDLVNNLSLSFNYNKTNSRGATTRLNEGWLWNASANYSLTFSRDLYFRPADIPYIGEFFNLFNDYRDIKVYFAPQSFTAAFSMNRKWSFLQARPSQSTPNLQPKPDVQRDFAATRTVGFNWIITEGGILNPSLGYSFEVQSTLAYLLLDEGMEKSEGQIWREILSGTFFGKDYNFKQTFDLRTIPKIPSIWDLDKYFSLDFSYNSSYAWQNNFQQERLGRSAGYSSRLNAGFNIRLKSLTTPFFEKHDVQDQPAYKARHAPAAAPQSTGGRRSGRGAPRTEQAQITEGNIPGGRDSSLVIKDSVLVPKDSVGVGKDLSLESDSLETPKIGKITVALEILKQSIKWLFFDYDQIGVNFSQNNSFSAGGMLGQGSGFNNFWGFNYDYQKGPGRAFMLGLTNDVGPRAVKGNFQDSYSQSNTIDIKTSRPLWEGAQLDLKWSVGWGINKTNTIETGSLEPTYIGVDTVGTEQLVSSITTGKLSRSFFSVPFLNSIKNVHTLYSEQPDSSKNLSKAFSEGFESFPIFGKLPFFKEFLNYIPRPNWNFSWTGLETLPIFSWAKRVTLSHGYDSNYSEDWKINPDGDQEVQMQKVEYGFAPLVGLTFNFDELFGGQFSSSIRFETRTSYNLGVTTKNITESFSQNINIQASWLKSGFELPLFGISLKNDLEISFAYTRGKNSNIIYDMDNWTDAGTPQDGRTTTTIEPKIRYVMSSRVTLSIFYRRNSVEPEGAARIPPTTTNEAGLDVRIAIQ
jgi:cell surface protein SprA